MPRKQKTDWLGIDVGGANIKAADTEDRVCAGEFALWKYPEKLAAELKNIIREFGGAKNIAVTMTGELADCFLTKREGVTFIANACVKAAGDANVFFYSVKGVFLPLTKACTQWEHVAASNWHALANWSARNSLFDGAGLVIDIGSTTTDIVPFKHHEVCSKGWTDTERLLAGELVYTGVERSAIAGITPVLPLRGKEISVMNELFATSLDAYLLTGEIAEDEDNLNTADGRAATKANAHARLARMVGGDATSISRREVEKMAKFIADRQARLIAIALGKMLALKPQELHFTGHGLFLAKRAVKLVSFGKPYDSENFGSGTGARCAPAIAVAELAEEYFQS